MEMCYGSKQELASGSLILKCKQVYIVIVWWENSILLWDQKWFKIESVVSVSNYGKILYIYLFAERFLLMLNYL